ncbi:hypothetical protein [Polyangium aurulentum]|uniref:hypothetical protein n=1 Tax=Polyangium aurulentum TaxID=2567896 RepID=UPI00146BC0E9|nr:hypothetical protein [Polyangium aurulentum]UQA56574.1 hypothetical protein E8A73_035480 [Polyangium aurulentum]
MDLSLGARARALVEEGKGEVVTGGGFLPLVTLDSGARIGLDAEGRFAIADAEGSAVTPYADADGHVFHEALEWKRSRFDDALEEGARSLGLPVDDVLAAFPVAGVVRAVLGKGMHYTTRLALHWLRPSELREVRDDLLRISKDKTLPTPIRELAERLCVPAQ